MSVDYARDDRVDEKDKREAKRGFEVAACEFAAGEVAKLRLYGAIRVSIARHLPIPD
jgi:hypothetical protein